MRGYCDCAASVVKAVKVVKGFVCAGREVYTINRLEIGIEEVAIEENYEEQLAEITTRSTLRERGRGIVVWDVCGQDVSRMVEKERTNVVRVKVYIQDQRIA